MLNGDLKSLLSLWENLARNHRYSTYVKPRDLKEVSTRVTNEGLPFLTVVLPSLGKALDTFHATNTWTTPSSFKTDGDGYPLFLGDAVKSAIEGNSVAVDCVRQLSYVFYKLEVPYDESAISSFLDHFCNNDLGLADIDFCDPGTIYSDPGWSTRGSEKIWLNPRRLPDGSLSRSAIVNEMAGIIREVLKNSDPYDIRPCHGTGVTACRTPNHEKWSTIRYYPKLDNVYDYATLFFFSPTHLVDDYEKLEQSREMVPRARVCLVPKDSRGPRVISCEPAELMFAQQGLMRKLYDILETNYHTRGQINFTDQRINKELARQASLDGSLATLDLKDASDMVSLELVRKVFPPDWVECLEACRSEETILPNGEVVKLNKFAPMGSACCFPVEALVFWSNAVATIRLARGRNPRVFVYGDDIICDVGDSALIMVGLEAIGLKVNRDKSYVGGMFRESCGGDYHNGYDVTPVRVRKVPSNVGTGLEASADLANAFIAKFGYEQSHSIVRTIEQVVGYTYPRTELQLPATIRVLPSASNDVFFRRRFQKDLQRFEHRILTSTADVLHRRPPDWWELLRKELTRERIENRYPYENRFSIIDSKLDPGSYVDSHTTRKRWHWAWLG